MFSSSCIKLVCYDNITTDAVQLCPMTPNDSTQIRAIWSSPLSSYDSRTPRSSTSIGPIWTFRPPRRHHHRTLALAKYAKITFPARVGAAHLSHKQASLIWNLKFILSTTILCVLSWGNLCQYTGEQCRFKYVWDVEVNHLGRFIVWKL